MRETQAYHWLYLTNVGSWFIGQRAFMSDVVHLGHLWSLAVEEHFYLIWPTVIFMARRTTIQRLCIALFLSALGLRCVAAVLSQPDLMPWLLTPLRWDGLAAGAYVAVLVDKHGIDGLRRYAPTARILLAFGSALLLCFFVVNKGLWSRDLTIFTIGLSVINLIFTSALVLALISPGICWGVGCCPT